MKTKRNNRVQWDHKIVQVLSEGPHLNDVLVAEGDNSWQLAAVVPSNDHRFLTLFFKRPRP